MMSNQNQIKYWPSGNVNNRNGRIILNKTLVDKKKKTKAIQRPPKYIEIVKTCILNKGKPIDYGYFKSRFLILKGYDKPSLEYQYVRVIVMQ